MFLDNFITSFSFTLGIGSAFVTTLLIIYLLNLLLDFEKKVKRK